MAVKDSLLDKFPEIAKEWDYDRNYPLRPEDITYGSTKEVYWICPICKQSYPSKISNRTAPSRKKKTKKCPVCLGRIIIPGYNSLYAKFPKIVEEEWDFEKNEVDPDTIAPYTNKEYWWKCKNGHSYPARVNNKTNNNGGNCPFCSHQRLSPEFSLAKVNPTLAKEWCYELNTKTPEEVFANSNDEAWWKCKYGHIWKAKICNRNNGRGCPECAKGRNSSFPEQVIYHYTRALFPDTISRYKHKGIEIDVYIPTLNLGIEYDGGFFHRTHSKVEKDIKKNISLYKDGISLIRIRENQCYPMNDNHCIIFNYNYSSEYKNLGTVIEQTLNYLCCKANITNTAIVDINLIRNQILKEISTVPPGKDLQSTNPELAKDWDYEKNYPLTPEMFFAGSEKKVFWKCSKCGYEWEANINSRNSGYGCHRCANRERYTTNSYIQAAKKTHGDKFDYSKTIYVNSKTPIIIICKRHGEFTINPSEHLAGKGCKFCAGQAFHKNEVLSVVYPHLVSEWDYDKNLSEFGITPETAFVRKRVKYYWHCNFGKPHSYQASIQDRIKRKMQCCICHGKQISEDRSVGYLFPELVAEWSPENDKTPFEVTPGSEYIAIWKCPNPNHEPYRQMVYNRCHQKTKCPYCSGNKKHPKDYEDELKKIFPNIEIIEPFKKSNIRIKCRCNICGNIWEPYPYSLLKSKGCPNCKK